MYSSEDLMERLNLNIPSEARARLRRLAKAAARTEAEVARDLLVAAIGRSERESFFAQVAASATDKVQKRELAVLVAFESLDA